MKCRTLALVALASTVSLLWGRPNIPGLARECNSLGKQSACRELVKLATRSNAEAERISAIDVLEDQSVLGEIALEGDGYTGDWSPALAAVGRLTEQSSLAKVALEGKGEKVRRIAVQRLTDQPLLAKVALASRNDVSPAAIRKLTDQSVVARIALEGTNSDVRNAAIERLTDQQLLAKVAAGDKDFSARRTALQALTDQAALAAIALGNGDTNTRRMAVERLTDQSMLLKIAMEERRDYAVSDAAISRFDSKTALSVALGTKDDNHAYNAVISDREKLGEKMVGMLDTADLRVVAMEGKSYLVRDRAAKTLVEKSNDQALLARMALDDKDATIRFYAAQKVTDPAVLLKAQGDTDKSVGAQAIKNRAGIVSKMTDSAALATLTSDGSPEIRVQAVLNPHLTDQSVIETVALRDSSLDVRSAAIGRILEAAALAKVASNETDNDLRESARLQLALWNPIIEKRFPRLVVTTHREKIYVRYVVRSGNPDAPGNTEGIEGQRVITNISLRGEPWPRAGRTIASGKWESTFPYSITAQTPVKPPVVDYAALFRDLLGSFSSTEIGELAQNSECRELREAAAYWLQRKGSSGGK